jgi:oxygen-independent coproporphyrinogen-3 oxidase
MSTIKNINIDLIRKYDRPGPRYTSYPPAPAFSSSFTANDFLQSLKENNTPANNAEMSLYYHIPFCDTLCYFCGCNMLITHSRERIAEYLKYLKREMELSAPFFNRNRRVGQLHWGGGTPSYLNPHEIISLTDSIKEHFDFSHDIEAGIEIDPRGLTFEHMAAFRESGFNRVSMGVQDFEPEVQEAINRIQPEEITRYAVEWSRKLGFKSINLDMIYGLPYQTLESFEKSLKKIIDISPERIAVFNFAHVPWLKSHQKLIDKNTLPLPEVKLEILKMTIELLTSSGYIYIGMDHFAKPSDELAIAQREKTLYRNFQGYSTHAGADLYAFGNSAISQFNNVYAQNYKSLNDYYKAIDTNLFPTILGYKMTKDDIIRQHVIMRLMCDMELNKHYIGRKFGINFDEYFAPAFQKFEEFVQDDLLELTDEKIIVKDLGRLVIRNIAMAFDAYLEKMMKERPIFSRTV